MKYISYLFLLCSGLSVSGATVDSVLARMDKAANSFQGMTSSIQMISHTAIIKESTEESGTIALRGTKTKTVNALINFVKPDNKSIAFRNKKVQIYLPKINTVQEYDMGKFDSLLTQGLLIGFATPAKEIRKNYQIKLLGEESVAGQACTKLELTPTQQTIQQHLSRLELWISNTTGLPVQEKLHQQSGDYTQIIYSDMKLVPGLTDQQVQLKLPADVKKEYPQK